MKNTATDPAAAATAPSAPVPQPPLLLERHGAVATLRFNRPEALNAIDVPMANAFLAAVQSIAADPGVRAVVLRGNGRGFMAGATWPRCARTRCRAPSTSSRRSMPPFSCWRR